MNFIPRNSFEATCAEMRNVQSERLLHFEKEVMDVYNQSVRESIPYEDYLVEYELIRLKYNVSQKEVTKILGLGAANAS